MVSVYTLLLEPKIIYSIGETLEPNSALLGSTFHVLITHKYHHPGDQDSGMESWRTHGSQGSDQLSMENASTTRIQALLH